MNNSTAFCVALFLWLPTGAQAAAASNWQGEWGQWSSPDAGAHTYGGSLSIFGCSEEKNSCRLRLDAESKQTRCGDYGKNGEGIEIRFGAGDSATAQHSSYDSQLKDCRLGLKLEAAPSGRQIRATWTGSECAYFCTHGASIPQTYPLRHRDSYPRLSTRECFADNRGSRQVWCLDPKVQALDAKLEEFNQKYSALSHDRALYDRIPIVRESALGECRGAGDVSRCLQDALAKRVAEFAQITKTAEERRSKTEASLAARGDAALAAKLIGEIDGVYKRRFANALVDGKAYTSEDILEIVPVAPDAIYFKTHLEFYNGHECERYGLAHFTQAGIFVFQDSAEPADNDPACRLQIAVTDKEIKILDPDSSCKTYCGARGNFDGAAFPRSARRTIRYMQLLKNSAEYREAIENLENATKPR